MEQQLNITLDKTTEIICDECDNKSFMPGVMLRKASKFLTGGTQDSLIPIQVFMCSTCGHVNEEFIPKALKEQYAEFEEIEKND